MPVSEVVASAGQGVVLAGRGAYLARVGGSQPPGETCLVSSISCAGMFHYLLGNVFECFGFALVISGEMLGWLQAYVSGKA